MIKLLLEVLLCCSLCNIVSSYILVNFQAAEEKKAEAAKGTADYDSKKAAKAEASAKAAEEKEAKIKVCTKKNASLF